MVRSIEAMGSSSGKTRQRVAIAGCGELPSRRQILAKMAAEKEALANMKKDPLQVLRSGCLQPAPPRMLHALWMAMGNARHFGCKAIAL